MFFTPSTLKTEIQKYVYIEESFWSGKSPVPGGVKFKQIIQVFLEARQGSSLIVLEALTWSYLHETKYVCLHFAILFIYTIISIYNTFSEKNIKTNQYLYTYILCLKFFSLFLLSLSTFPLSSFLTPFYSTSLFYSFSFTAMDHICN